MLYSRGRGRGGNGEVSAQGSADTAAPIRDVLENGLGDGGVDPEIEMGHARGGGGRACGRRVERGTDRIAIWSLSAVGDDAVQALREVVEMRLVAKEIIAGRLVDRTPPGSVVLTKQELSSTPSLAELCSLIRPRGVEATNVTRERIGARDRRIARSYAAGEQSECLRESSGGRVGMDPAQCNAEEECERCDHIVWYIRGAGGLDICRRRDSAPRFVPHLGSPLPLPAWGICSERAPHRSRLSGA